LALRLPLALVGLAAVPLLWEMTPPPVAAAAPAPAPTTVITAESAAAKPVDPATAYYSLGAPKGQKAEPAPADAGAGSPHRLPRRTDGVQFDWDKPTKSVRLAIDQNKARVLGFSSQDIAAFLNNAVSGVTVTNYRDGDKLIDVVVRGVPAERAALSSLKDLAIPSKNGKAVPITQVAEISYGQEDGLVWRRNRLPTITVRADVRGDAQGPDVTNAIDPKLATLRAGLPLGYRIEVGGAIEDSAKGQKSIVAGVPLHQRDALGEQHAEVAPVHQR
jgi:hypothetical protein